MSKEISKSIKDWYIKEFPLDSLGAEIHKSIKFEDLINSLGKHEDIYKFLGVVDSIVRERVFAKLADIMGVTYKYIYEQWLN